MKLKILSDLHLEFAPFEPPDTPADVVILAGDIHGGKRGIDWINATFPDRPVIYVLGNHEYYSRAYPKHYQDLRQLLQGSNIQVLENEAWQFEEVTFLGCTLWTDFELYGDPKKAGYQASQTLTDYRKIRVSPSYRKLRALDTANIHHQSVQWLRSQLASLQETQQTVVIVTHHAPSPQSVHAVYGNDSLNAAYASNLEPLIARSQARLWVHGHTHQCHHYVVGQTEVICNPRGYPDERIEGFNPGLTVEI